MTDSAAKFHLASLRSWAERAVPPVAEKGQPRAPWGPVKRLITLLETFGESSIARYRELVLKSNELLHPLCDPLTCELNLHDWLKPEREESYTMWLQWSLMQLGDWASVSVTLGLNENVSRNTGPISIEREVGILFADGAGRGRLDIVIREASVTVCVLEIKTKGFSDDDLGKQEFYLKSPRLSAHSEGIFIAPEAEGFDLRGFRFLPWSELCIRLRRIAPHVASKKNLSTAALLLAFVGAVEQNVLGLMPPGNDLSSLPATVEHLEKFVHSLR